MAIAKRARVDSPLRSVILRYFRPVHYVPPGFDVVGAAVLVVQVVGVLPNIAAQDRRVAVHQRAVLVLRRNPFKFSALVFDQPRPAAAETADTGGGEFFFELIEPGEC